MERQNADAYAVQPIHGNQRAAIKFLSVVRQDQQKMCSPGFRHERMASQENEARSLRAGAGENLGEIEIVREDDAAVLTGVSADG